jgi:GAF domain-containing protein
VLETLTLWFNVLALAVSFCLGLYLVTRDLRNRSAWLAALTMWSLAAFFLNNALSIQVPESSLIPWLRMISLFAMPFWLNLAVILRREQVGAAGATWLDTADKIAVPLAYLVSGILILAQVFEPGLLFTYTEQALILADWQTGPLYSMAALITILEGALSFLSLREARDMARSKMVKRQLAALLAATVLSGSGALYIALGVWLGLAAPSLIGDFLIFVGIALLGYAVARYNALIAGRTVDRDLLYVFVLIGSLTFVNVLIALSLFLRGHMFSFVTLMLVMIVAISSLMLYDGVRSTLDRLFYRDQYRQLRANLRAMAREAGSGRTLAEQLQTVLVYLTNEAGFESGFIALNQETEYKVVATRNSLQLEQTLPTDKITADEIVQGVSVPGEGGSGQLLLAPIYGEDHQIGALALNQKDSSQVLTDDELFFLDELTDELAAIILTANQQDDYAQQINSTVDIYRRRERELQRQVNQLLSEERNEAQAPLDGVSEKEFKKLVENALRNLDDYTFLGQHKLAGLKVVDLRLQQSKEEFVTHIDRGKALSDILILAINKLRPAGDEPRGSQLPSREWYQYTVLHEAYVEGVMNRDIMSKLYISEGTFNRARRRAVRGVARALQEMEQGAKERNSA